MPLLNNYKKLRLTEREKILDIAKIFDAPVIFLSTDFFIIDYNDTASKLYALNKKSVLKKTYFEWCASNQIMPAIAPEDKDQILRGKKISSVETHTYDGKHAIAWNVLCNLDDDNLPIEIVLIGKEIAKANTNLDVIQQKNLAAINKNTIGYDIGNDKSATGYLVNIQYLEKVIAAMPCYVFWKDKNFVYMGCNDLVANLLKLKSYKEIIGKTDYDFGWKKEVVDEFRKVDEEIILTGKPRLNLEDIITVDGHAICLLVNKMPIFDKNNQAIGIVGISVDITKEKKQVRESLEKANRARLEFISTASHEVRNPISGVISYASFLKENLETLEDILPDRCAKRSSSGEIESLLRLVRESSEYCQVMNSEAGHAMIALKNLGDLHLMQLNGVSIRLGIINIHALLDIAISKSTFPNSKNVQIEKSVYTKMLKNVIIDAKNVTTALGIVIGNAFRFSHSNGKIIIGVKKSKKNRENQFVISLQDFGVGMHENQIKSLLAPSSDATNSDAANGEKAIYSKPSVQLSRAKMYIEASGGSLDIESTLGQGTIVRLTVVYQLPEVEQSGKPIQIDMTDEPVKRLITHSPYAPIATVLLVEDDLTIQKITSLQLARLGCQVDTAQNGADGIKMATEKNYDIALLDITLPDMSGLDVMRQVRTLKGESILFFALSSHGSPEDEEYFMTQGFMMLLAKPVDSESLKDAIPKAFEI